MIAYFVHTASAGGYCNSPGECVCKPGYNGTLCDIGEKVIVNKQIPLNFYALYRRGMHIYT